MSFVCDGFIKNHNFALNRKINTKIPKYNKYE
jgi:hypothetical protein